jgi:acetylornithine deacetylase/succinyl-diaminopimelate desuccinylase-like protein
MFFTSMVTSERLEQLLRDLIALPSVSPEGDPGTDQTGEKRVAAYLENLFSRCGAQARMQEARPGRPNLIVSFKPRGEIRRRIALAPHLDTVSVAGMTIPPFCGEVRDGRMYGRGASDTKGPAAAAIAALLTLAESEELPAQHTEWIFLGLAGEEDGSFGAQALCESGFSADLVVALEPTDNQVVCAHKGALWLTLKTSGRSAHGSAPQRGENAIYKMGRALTELENLAVEFGGKRHPSLGGASLNTGRIIGGSRINTVPDSCELWVDIRTHSAFTGDEALAELKQRLPSDVSIEILRNACPLEADPSDPLIKMLQEQSEGQSIADWFSDASVFAEHGIPAVVFGPGSIHQAHTADEWIELKELEQGSDILNRFIRRVNALDYITGVR